MYAAIEATTAIRQIMIKGDILFDSCLTHSLEAIIDRYKQDGTIQPVSLSAANAYYSKLQLTSPNSIASSTMVGLHPAHQQHLLQQQHEQQGQLRERDYLRPAVIPPPQLPVLPHQQMSFQQYEQLHLQQQRAGAPGSGDGGRGMDRFLPSAGRGGYGHDQQPQYDRRAPNSAPFPVSVTGSPLSNSPHSDSRAMTQVYPPQQQQQRMWSGHNRDNRGMDEFLPPPPVAERYSSYPGAGGRGGGRGDRGGYNNGPYTAPNSHDFRDEISHRMTSDRGDYLHPHQQQQQQQYVEEEVYEDVYYPPSAGGGNQFPSQHAVAHNHYQQQPQQQALGRPPFPRNPALSGATGGGMRDSPPNSFYHHNTPTNSFYDNSNNPENRGNSSPASSYSHSSSFIYQTSSGAVSSGSALPSPASAAFPTSFFPPTPGNGTQQHQHSGRGQPQHFFDSGSHSSWNLNEGSVIVHDDNNYPRKDSVGSHPDEMINGIASDISNLNITNPFSQIEIPPASSSSVSVGSSRVSLSSIGSSSPVGPLTVSSSVQQQLQHEEGQEW
jgi:hypothetical protein